MSITGMWTMGSHIRGVNVAICCELCLESKEEGKSRGGTSAKLRGSVTGSVRKLGLVDGKRWERVGREKGNASTGNNGNCEDNVDGEVQGGHQQ